MLSGENSDARIDKLREEEELGKEAKREYKRQKKAEAEAAAQEVQGKLEMIIPLFNLI